MAGHIETMNQELEILGRIMTEFSCQFHIPGKLYQLPSETDLWTLSFFCQPRCTLYRLSYICVCNLNLSGKLNSFWTPGQQERIQVDTLMWVSAR